MAPKDPPRAPQGDPKDPHPHTRPTEGPRRHSGPRALGGGGSGQVGFEDREETMEIPDAETPKDPPQDSKATEGPGYHNGPRN